MSHSEIVYIPGHDGPLAKRQPNDKTELLCKEIAEAAKRLGLYNGEVALDGPQILMFLKEIETAAEQGIAMHGADAFITDRSN